MKYTLITGATSGIGLEFAKLFAKNQHNLVLVARNKENLKKIKIQLNELYDIKVILIDMDISGEINSKILYEKVKKLGLNIDILINNAGIGVYGSFSNKPIESDISQINLNIITPTILTKLFLKDMLKSNSGKIFNIASTASFQSGPLMSVYYATKSYLLNFSEGLSEEIRKTNVRIVTFCPGPTKTNFEKMKNIDLHKVKNFHISSSTSVARFLYKNINTKKDILIHGNLNFFMVLSSKFLPRKLNLKLIKQIQRKKERNL